MDIEIALRDFENSASNLRKLRQIWEQAKPFIPVGPSLGTDPQYEILNNQWNEIRKALPAIDGWNISVDLPDIAEIGEIYFDASNLGMPELAFRIEDNLPEGELLEYDRKLQFKRRQVFKGEVQKISDNITRTIQKIVIGIPRNSTDYIDNENTESIKNLYKQLVRITNLRSNTGTKWADFERHYSFSEGHDWHDIKEYDWPSIQNTITNMFYSEFDPIEVTASDLGIYSSEEFSGVVLTSIIFENLNAEEFENLLFDMLTFIPNYINVANLMHVNTPDQGKDISFSLKISDGVGGELHDSGILQAKHWKTHSVGHLDIDDALRTISLWEPPKIKRFIVATSGKFTRDAVQWVQSHNNVSTHHTHIDLWDKSKLENLLMGMPELVAKYKLTQPDG